jgi:uncharacterized SAM-binding protein YcdF (DUF218 family)
MTSVMHRRWASVCVGSLLVADALFLMSLRVFSIGVLLPLAFGIAFVALGMRWTSLRGWIAARPGRERAWTWGWRLLLLWAISVALFWTVLARAAGAGSAAGEVPRAIVVLGSGTPGGKASPVLAARLELALRQAAQHPGAVVIVSGGVDRGETLSEAQVMGDYLRGRGLAAARILQEERSRSTEENLLFSAPLLRQRGIGLSDPVQVVTSDFHTLRARWIGENLGYTRLATVGADTPLYVRYNAWLREYFAVASGWLLREFG